jgi:hypothetical protein
MKYSDFIHEPDCLLIIYSHYIKPKRSDFSLSVRNQKCTSKYLDNHNKFDKTG